MDFDRLKKDATAAIARRKDKARAEGYTPSELSEIDNASVVLDGAAIEWDLTGRAKRLVAEQDGPPPDDWEQTPEPANDAPNPLADTAKANVRAKEPFPLVYAPDLAAPLPVFEWLSPGWNLIKGRVLGWTGYGDAGKTYAGMDMGIAVAAGLPKCMGDLDLGLSGPVVHIDFEQQSVVTRWRYQRLAVGRSLDLAALGTSLSLSSLPPMTLVDPKAQDALCKLLDGKALAIVDNLTAGAPGLDQNASAIAAPIYMLGRVSEVTGCTIVLVHHDNKSSADGTAGRSKAQMMRGSGAIHAALGGGIGFTKEAGGIIRYEQTKETMGSAPEPAYFRFVDVGEIDPNTRRTKGIKLEWTPVEQAMAAKDKANAGAKASVRHFLEVHGPKPKKEIERDTRGAGTAAKRDAIDALIATGEIVTEAGPRGAIICRLAGPPDEPR